MASAPTARLLLCACPLHCAQVLRCLGPHTLHPQRWHDLQVRTDWPLPLPASSDAGCTPLQVWWALLPTDAPAAAQLREHTWRQHWHQQLLSARPSPATPVVQMLYGTAAQQAQQLAPAPPAHHTGQPLRVPDDCQECLDARSEQQLFRRLLNHT